MAIVKPYTTPQGVESTYHRLVKIELNGMTGDAEFVLAIYSSSEAAAAGASALWHEYVRMSIADIEQSPFAAFYPLLTTHPASYLVGGSNDEAAPEMAFSVAGAVLNTPDPTMLETVRQSRLQQIRDKRNSVEYGTFVWDGSTFNASQESVVRLIGCVMMSSWIPNFSVSWTTADDLERTLSAAEIGLLAQALGAHTLSAHQKYKAAKTALQAATTIEEIQAVTWPA
jgi:hypothetical protein